MLWFVDQDSVAVFDADLVVKLHSEEDFERRKDIPHMQLPELAENSLKEQQRLLIDLVGRVPELHYWDSDEPQLLAVEWSKSSSSISSLERRRIDSTFSIRSDKISSVSTKYNIICVCAIHQDLCRLRIWSVPFL